MTASVGPDVAPSVRECRMLAPDEVAELVEAYRRGATELSLAREYGVHRHTVDRHLERAGVVKRPVVKMTPARVELAKELYEQGLSSNQIGKKFGISGSTVWTGPRRLPGSPRPGPVDHAGGPRKQM
ncbi:hypothetical protein ACKI1U_27685, partial [Streptomyces scabiei]